MNRMDRQPQSTAAITVILTLSRDEAIELERICEDAARAARMNRMEMYIERIFQRLLTSIRRAQAVRTLGCEETGS